MTYLWPRANKGWHFLEHEFMSSLSNPSSSHPILVKWTTWNKGGWGWPLLLNKDAEPLASFYIDVMATHVVCCDFLWISDSCQSYFQICAALNKLRETQWDNSCDILFEYFDTLVRNRRQQIRDVKAAAGLDERMTSNKGLWLWINMILWVMNMYKKFICAECMHTVVWGCECMCDVRGD